ncbi:Pycsar system effector family protein [Pseudonocardia hierapolitana]|uniref:Pycsar system effector family protein n=1 Tax=Pseudonocardia hierapolitana TaxID=1128676 RepID=UPI0011BF1E82|nr:Pycsar system effector family protein [Pseudonocardia hierapolitana]
MFLALTTIGPWVNNADTKIGLLAAALTVMTGGAIRQRPRVETVLLAGMDTRGSIALASLAVCALALLTAGIYLFRALKPRLTNTAPSRFAFPHLADADLSQLTDSDPAAVRAEGWIQAQTLARIVRHKYTCFRKALIAGTIAGGAFVTWLLLVPI